MKYEMSYGKFRTECVAYGYTTKEKKLAFARECSPLETNPNTSKRISVATLQKWICRIEEDHPNDSS